MDGRTLTKVKQSGTLLGGYAYRSVSDLVQTKEAHHRGGLWQCTRNIQNHVGNCAHFPLWLAEI